MLMLDVILWFAASGTVFSSRGNGLAKFSDVIKVQQIQVVNSLYGVYKQFSVIVDGNLLNIVEVKSIIYFICTT